MNMRRVYAYRGSLTVWISLTAGKLVNWDAKPGQGGGNLFFGRQDKYSNHAIETAVTLGMVFHLSSRQSEGLLRSLFALMKLDNDVPDHTTISRRKPKLGKVPFYQVKQKTPFYHILIDSSGLAVHAGQLLQSTKEQGLSQAPSVCRRAEWRSRRRRAGRAKEPAIHRGLHRLSDRSTVPSDRPELTPHTTPAASMRQSRITALIARRGC